MGPNITLAVDANTVEKAREVARRQGTSLNALIRRYIEQLAGQQSGEQLAAELRRLWSESTGRSENGRFNRAELYEERVGKSRLR